MALRDDLKTWIPKLLFEVFNKPEGYIVTSADWNAMWNLNREQGDWDSNTIRDILTMLYETVLHDADGALAVTVSEPGITATNVSAALLEILTKFDASNVDLDAFISDVEARLESHRISGDHDNKYYLKSDTYTKAQVDAIAAAFVLGTIPSNSITDAKLSGLSTEVKARLATAILDIGILYGDMSGLKQFAPATTQGTASAFILQVYTLGNNSQALAPGDGDTLRVKFHLTPNAGATLNVNANGAKPIITSKGLPISTEVTVGHYLTLIYNGASYVIQGESSVISSPKYELLQEYDAAGNYTFTVPAGVNIIAVELVGAGGGGGSGTAAKSQSYASGGAGGNAGYVGSLGPVTVAPGDTFPCIVGLGGVGGVSKTQTATTYLAGANGGTGGLTSFDGHRVLGGGGGNGGPASVASASPSAVGTALGGIAYFSSSGPGANTGTNNPTPPVALNLLSANPALSLLTGDAFGAGGGAGACVNGTAYPAYAGGTVISRRPRGVAGTGGSTMDYANGTRTGNPGTNGTFGCGGGGGGGAASGTGTAISGAGGNGGDGLIRIYKLI